MREVLYSCRSVTPSEILYKNIDEEVNVLYISNCILLKLISFTIFESYFKYRLSRQAVEQRFCWSLFFSEQMSAPNFYGSSFQLILSHASITLATNFFWKSIKGFLVSSFLKNLHRVLYSRSSFYWRSFPFNLKVSKHATSLNCFSIAVEWWHQSK